MIAFIQQEAAEKVEEIEAKAEEEFNIEKSRLVAQQRLKIIDFYDKKEKQIELQRQIQQSNLANASRLSILKARDDYIQALKDEACKQLSALSQDQTKYRKILSNLITQGLFVLGETDVTIRCRQVDVRLVQELLPESINRFKSEFNNKQVVAKIDEKNFIAGDSFVVSRTDVSFLNRSLFVFQGWRRRALGHERQDQSVEHGRGATLHDFQSNSAGNQRETVRSQRQPETSRLDASSRTFCRHLSLVFLESIVHLSSFIFPTSFIECCP